MKGLILAGGLGTRLGELTRHTPKCLILVQDEPMIQKVITFFNKQPVSEIGVVIHEDQVEAFKQWKDNYTHDIPIRFFVEAHRAGTFGCIRLAKSWLGAETFVTANGDCLMDFDVEDVLQQHMIQKAVVTLALVRPIQSGTFVVPQVHKGWVRTFERKPVSAMTDYICSGFQIVEPKIFEYDTNKEYAMMEDDMLRELSEMKMVFGVKLPRSRFIDCGTPDSLEIAQRVW